MVRYLKLIIIIFGSIGIIAASFFYFQNKTDISYALEYADKIDYAELAKSCPDGYIYPCLRDVFESYLAEVSLTGTSMGLKMVFSVMDYDKDRTKRFKSEQHRDLQYSINYLEINNMAIKNPIKRYHGFDSLYGGYIATLTRYYDKAYHFSDNIIIGLEGHEGIKTLNDKALEADLTQQLEVLKNDYYSTKQVVEIFLEAELNKINAGRGE